MTNTAALEAPLLVERSDGVVTATFNRPHRKNALDAQTLRSLIELLRAVRRRREDRVLVLTGAAGDFSSGADLGAPGGLSGDPEDHELLRMDVLSELIGALHDLPKPTVAKVRGVAVGAGLGLALACDLVAVADTARLSLIFSRRGLSLDGGTSWTLPRLVGLHRAKELAFFADMLSGREAAELGLVNRAVTEEELDGVVDGWCQKLRAGPPLGLAMTKRMLNASVGSSMAEALEAEARCQTVNFASSDTAEAMAAFFAKRDPVFQGR
jgi:enoyl-CoA hydratase/carnithine racemase